MFPQNTQWKKIGLPEDFQLLETARLQKTGRQSQKNTDRQTSAIRRMSKQNKRSNVESSIQKPFLNKPLLRRRDIYVHSKHISKILFIWSENTSIYHHANNFEEKSDLLKQRVSCCQKRVQTKHKIRIKTKSRKRAPATFNSGSELNLTTTHL